MPRRYRGRRRYRRRFQRRSARFRAYRRRRRAPRRTLRLYPAGAPRSHLVKLRMVNQCAIFNVPGEWGGIPLFPASMLQPLIGQLTAVGVDGIYTGVDQLKWTDKTLDSRDDVLVQPHGYDHWLGTSNSAKYQNYQVLGSHINITFIQGNSAAATLSERFVGGFTDMFAQSGADPNQGPEFQELATSVVGGEVATMLGNGLIRNPKVISTGANLSDAVSFDFYYSQKKWLRRLRRIGITDLPSSHGTHATAPGLNPLVVFVLADLGVATAAAVGLHCIITHTYTARLVNFAIGQTSAA